VVDSVIEYVKARIEEVKKSIAECEELIRLGELMGIDVSEHKIRLEDLKRKLRTYEDGLRKYESVRSVKTK